MEPLFAAMCSAVALPDGAGTAAIGVAVGHRHAPNAPQKGAPAGVLGVHIGARAEQRRDDRVVVIERRPHQRCHSRPAHGGAGGGGEPRSIRVPSYGNSQPLPDPEYTPGSRGAAPQNNKQPPEWPTRKGFWRVRAYSEHRPLPTPPSRVQQRRA